jgi:Cell division protein CrgA
MPESSTRKKKSVKPSEAGNATSQHTDAAEPNPSWFAPVMFGFMLLGLIWIITFYVTGAQYPLGSGLNNVAPALNLGNWNILIGFGVMMVGFVMSTRWK